MKLTLKLLFIFFLISNNISSQEIKGKLIDSKNGYPIPYATIQMGEKYGVISNEEGFFNIDTQDESVSSITVSCMGYITKTISLNALIELNYTLILEEAVNTLQEVNLNNKPPNVDSIIAKVNLNIKKNYHYNSKNHKIFYRESNMTNFSKIDFEIEKAKHLSKNKILELNRNTEEITNTVKNTDFKQYTDFLGNIFINDIENSKLTVEKVTNLIDVDKNFDVDILQDRIQNSFLKSLDTTITYKLKTGIITIDDSISFKKTEEEKATTNEYEVVDLKNTTAEVLNESAFYEESFLMKIIDENLYNYNLEDFTFYNDALVYVISFEPRRSRSKFTGKLYITEDDYALLRVDYQYAEGKRGEKVNLKLLLGIKFVEDKHNGTILFKKNNMDKYEPNYIKRNKGQYVYLSRSLKFIENSKEKNKTKLDLTIELNNVIRNELLFINSENISLQNYKDIKQKGKVPYMTIEKYDPKLWNNESVLEPLIEMKKFGTMEE